MDALPLINEKIIINKKDDKRMTKYWQCMEEKRMIKKLDTDDINPIVQKWMLSLSSIKKRNK